MFKNRCSKMALTAVKCLLVPALVAAFTACAPKKSPPTEFAPKADDMSKLFKNKDSGLDYEPTENDKALEAAIESVSMNVVPAAEGGTEVMLLTLNVKLKDSSVLPEQLADVQDLMVKAQVSGDGQTVEGVMEESEDAVKAKMQCDKGCKRVIVLLTVQDQEEKGETIQRRAGYGFDVVKVPGTAEEPLWKKNEEGAEKEGE